MSRALTALVDEWLAAQRSANTRAAYAGDFRRFAGWCADHEVDPVRVDARELRRYRTAVERSGVSSATTARRLAVVSSFGAFVTERGAATGFAVVGRPAVTPSRVVTTIDDADAAALLRAADGLGARAGLLLRLLMLDGLKVGEAIAADAAHVSGKPPAMSLVVGRRTVHLHPDTSETIDTYLRRRRAGPLVLSAGRARRTDRLSRFGVDYLVKEVARAAGVEGSVSGNTLRRRYVVAAHAEGVGLDEIQRRAGHADVRTTRRYLS